MRIRAKAIFCLFFVVMGKSVFAQNFKYKITSREYHWATVFDSIQSETNNRIEGTDLKFYSNHQEFKLQNGNVLKINFYADSTIYFEERDSSSVLLSQGELFLDKTKQTIVQTQIFVCDEYGEPVLDSLGNWVYGVDISFQLVPHGLWYFRVSPRKIAKVNYLRGEKHGASYEILKTACRTDSIYLSKSLYENGTKKSELVTSLTSQKDITTFIQGTWYHPRCMEEDRIWIFQRAKPYSNPRDGIQNSTFLKNGKYNAELNYSCLTGRTKDDYFLTEEWKVDNNHILTLGKRQYAIVFLSAEFMVLEGIK